MKGSPAKISLYFDYQLVFEIDRGRVTIHVLLPSGFTPEILMLYYDFQLVYSQNQGQVITNLCAFEDIVSGIAPYL